MRVMTLMVLLGLAALAQAQNPPKGQAEDDAEQGQIIEVKMLAQGRALLVIAGKSHMLSVGATSPEGVTLVAADNKQAVIEVDGQRKTLSLFRHISTRFSHAQKAEVRIAGGAGGHYITPGLINGLPVQFMVDTGATFIAMNYHDAERLGIDYRAGGQIDVATANGSTKAFLVNLNSVSVGNVLVHQVAAIVHDSDSPSIILLGNSYLSLVDMSVDQGVMLIRAKH